jgi:hypothetical protein
MKFSYIMLILALTVAGCAAYFSIWGLSQLFAGASTAVIIMASALEIGKVVTTTALHTYWNKLAGGLKVYLTISVGILMVITSVGIYGFLSNAYQSTANKLEIHEGELGVLEAKKSIFEKTIIDNIKIIDSKTKRSDQLNSLRSNQETRLDSAKYNSERSRVRIDIINSDNQIQALNKEIDELNLKNVILSDSVNLYNVKAIELKAGSEVAGEVGPLKYISELTGTPMANVVNYMILLLIFVFDPLAIALVLATNRIFQLEGKQTPLEPKVNFAPSAETPTTIVEVMKENAKETPIIVDEETGEIDLHYDEMIIEDDYFLMSESEELKEELLDIKEIIIPIKEPILEEEQYDDTVNDTVNDESTTVSEKNVEVPVYKKEPVIPTGKVNFEDIKEIKEGRGFSVDIPNPKTSNTIERIGSNKIIKNGDNNKVFFKRK